MSPGGGLVGHGHLGHRQRERLLLRLIGASPTVRRLGSAPRKRRVSGEKAEGWTGTGAAWCREIVQFGIVCGERSSIRKILRRLVAPTTTSKVAVRASR